MSTEYNLCPKCGGVKGKMTPELREQLLLSTRHSIAFPTCTCKPDSVVKCDYCAATENVTTFSDRTEQKPDIHICTNCYRCGVGSKLGGRLTKEQEQ